MGRPVKKDRNGVLVFGTYGTNTPGDASAGIRCEAYINSSVGNQTDVYIAKQSGARSYYVIDTSVGTGTRVKAKLVSGTPAAVGEMRITAYLAGGADGSATYLRKLTKRFAWDFSGNKYTWQLTNFADSSADQIELTPV